MSQTNYDRSENIPFQPNIGLDASVRQSVVEMLNLLLADEAVLSYKTRRANGNPSGASIPELQPVYDDQCKQIAAISDEIIERVQILSGSHHSGTRISDLNPRLGGERNAVPSMVNILAYQEAFIRFLREDVQKCSELYEDQGTFALLVNVMRSHEKMAWILRSNIPLKQFNDEI